MKIRVLCVAILVCLVLAVAGSVYAAEPARIELEQDCVSQAEEGYIELNGKIVDDDGDLVPQHFRLNVYVSQADIDSDAPLYSEFALNGRIELQLPGDLEPGDYYLVAEDLQETFVVETAVFYVTVGLDTDDSLDFVWGQEEELLYTGRLLQEAGEYKEVVLVLDGKLVVAVANVTTSGSFALYADVEEAITMAGALELFAASEKTGLTPGSEVTSSMLSGLIKVTEGKVAADQANITVKPNEAFYGLDNELILSVDKDRLHGFSTEAGMNLVYKFEWILEHDDKTITIPIRYGEAFSSDDLTVCFDDVDQPRFASEDRGTWNVTLNVVGNNGKPLYVGTTTFEVQRPAAVNLIGLKDTITVADGYEFQVGSDVKIARFKNDELSDFADTFIISASGAGVEPIEGRTYPYTDSEGNLVRTVSLRPTKAGTITLTITGKRGSELIGTFERQIRVEGASAELNLTQLEVETEALVKVTVTDENGRPINNAYVEFVDHNSGLAKYTINKYGRENIVGGVYQLDVSNDTFKLPAEYEVIVRSHLDDQVISYGGTLTVTGKQVYSVTVTPGELLAGERDTVIVKINDSDGDVVIPDSIVFATKNERMEFSEADILRGRVDLNDDRSYDAIELEVPAFLYAGEGTVLVQRDQGTKIGLAEFSVVAPELKLFTETQYVTDKYYETLEFAVVDPRSGEALEWDLTLQAAYAELVDVIEGGDSLEKYIDDDQSLILNGDDRYELEILTSVDWDNVAQDELPSIVLSAEGITVGGSLLVRPAMLAIDPEEIVIGQPVELTITLTSANGKPLAGYQTYVNSSECMVTDEQGQAVYRSGVTAFNTVVIEANSDYEAYIDGEKEIVRIRKVVNPGTDTTAPTVEYSEVVYSNRVELVIRDNVRLSRVAINGKEVTIFPSKEARVHVDLQPGDNKIHIQAMDVNYNVLDTTIVVHYATSGEPDGGNTGGTSVEIQLGVDTGFGAPELKDNTTMVPVRVAQKMLGASMEWDPQVRAVTYSLGDVTIVAKEGSNVVEVNGVKTAVPVAPYIKDNRLYVPLRLIAQELGFSVNWQGHNKPIVISK